MPESPPAPTLQYCVDADQVQEVNLPNNQGLAVVYLRQPDRELFQDLICVESDNNPEFGRQVT